MTSHRSLSRVLFLICLLALTAIIAGCSADASIGGSVSEKELEKQGTTQLTKVAGEDVKVDCDDKLKAKKGEKLYCTGTAESTDGLEQTVAVDVNGVKDGKADLHYQILKILPADQLQSSLKEQIDQASGADVTITGCDEDVDIEKGESFTCGVEGLDDAEEVTVTFTDYDGAINIETA